MATLLLADGAHPKIVQDRLGHSSVAIALDLYSHVSPAMQSEVAARLDKIIGDASTKPARERKCTNASLLT
jgi:integrase